MHVSCKPELPDMPEAQRQRNRAKRKQPEEQLWPKLTAVLKRRCRQAQRYERKQDRA